MTPPPPPFTEEHEELRQSIRGFLERELAPHAQEWEEQRWFPNELFPRLAAQGLLGLKYPLQYGGQGGDYLHDAVLCEEMARIGSGGTAAGIGAHVNIATPPIWKFGSEEQKQRFLAPAIRGEKTYITNGVRADFIVTAVKSTPAGGHHGISFLIIERGEGVASAKLEKLGWHASDTATIAFEEVFVPEQNLLGPLHQGCLLYTSPSPRDS